MWGSSKEPQRAISSGTAKVLYVRNYFGRLLFIVAQANHFDVCAQNSLLHLNLRCHLWVVRIRWASLSFDCLGERCSLGRSDFGIFQ